MMDIVIKLIIQKLLLGPSEAMSKSKKNIIDPGSMIKIYGADAIRWFMLSDSPRIEIFSGLMRESRHHINLFKEYGILI
jgi:leucyl-tRNA synthetase